MNWQDNVIVDSGAARALLGGVRSIAVLGIKTEAQGNQPAFYVPSYMAAAGYEVIPVPVYYPDATHILGRRVYRKLVDIPRPPDMVNVFRRSIDVPAHLQDMLDCKPKIVWMQLGIQHDGVAEKLARAGIKVVQDRCLMVDHQRYAASHPRAMVT